MSARKNHGKPKARDPASSSTASAGLSTFAVPTITSTSGAVAPPAVRSKGATTMSTSPNPIVFLDLLQNNQQAIAQTLADVNNLSLQFAQNNGLTDDLILQLKNDLQFLANAGQTGTINQGSLPSNVQIPQPQTAAALGFPPPTVLDPMFSGIWGLALTPPAQANPGVRDTMTQITGQPVGDIDSNGEFPSQQPPLATAVAAAAGAGGGVGGTTAVAAASAPQKTSV